MELIHVISYFFIYSFVGWILEVSYKAMSRGKYINSGFLNGPYCPIYGTGAVLVLSFLSWVGGENKLIILLASFIITTVLELITGFILEKLFHEKWWDYSNQLLNIGGYICLEFSLIWAALAFILYEAIHPLIVKLVGYFSVNVLLVFNIIMTVVLLVDLLQTINTLLGINKKFKQIEESSEKIREFSDKIGVRVAEKSFDAKERKEELENTPLAKEIDHRNEEARAKLKEIFEKSSERRILRAFPNLRIKVEKKIKEKIDE